MAPSTKFRYEAVGWILFVLIAAGSLFLLFHPFSNGAVVAMDSAPYWIESEHHAVRQGFFNLWSNQYWLGQLYGPIAPDQNALILALSQFPFSLKILYSANMLLGAIGMFWLLRSLKLSFFASILGGLAMALSSEVVTLVFPGHLTKVMSYAWFPFSIAAFIQGLDSKKRSYFAVSGAFLGLGILGGEMQVASYLGLWYVVWAAVRFWQSRKTEGNSLALVYFTGLLLVGGCSLALGSQKTEYFLNILEKSAPIAGNGATDENWKFATQFYFPPEEMLSYVTTVQFFGAPFTYWGRDGSPTPLRWSDDYMGLIPLGFAVLGGIMCWRVWQARLFVWMGIGSLLISFGREGILFWLLYHLPTMKSQRNPHRWSYFVALAACVLAAYGADWLWKKFRGTEKGSPSEKILPQDDHWKFWKRMLLVAMASGLALFAIAGGLTWGCQSVAEVFYAKDTLASPQGPLCVERTRLLLISLVRTGLFLTLSAAGVYWVIAERLRNRQQDVSLRSLLPWGAILIVLIADLAFNAKRYVYFYDWKERYEHHDLVQFFKGDPDLFRVKVLGAQENQELNDLVTNVLPFHQIGIADPPAASRVPVDYAEFFRYAQEHFMRSDRYFDLFNIKYLISPAPFSDSYAKFDLVAKWKGLGVYKREGFMPRTWLVFEAKVIKEGNQAVLFEIIHPSFNLRKTVVLQESPSLVSTKSQVPETKVAPDSSTKKKDPAVLESQKTHAPQDGSNRRNRETMVVPMASAENSKRSAHVSRYEDNRIDVGTDSDVAAMLVLSEKWDPDWKCWIDGQPTKIFKANFLMRAVEVPPGKHLVRMEYRPSLVSFWISAGSIGIFVLYGIACMIRRLLGSGQTIR